MLVNVKATSSSRECGFTKSFLFKLFPPQRLWIFQHKKSRWSRIQNQAELWMVNFSFRIGCNKKVENDKSFYATLAIHLLWSIEHNFLMPRILSKFTVRLWDSPEVKMIYWHENAQTSKKFMRFLSFDVKFSSRLQAL